MHVSSATSKYTDKLAMLAHPCCWTAENNLTQFSHIVITFLPPRCEKEYALSQRQLQAELTDKRTLVTNLKQQLDQHQSNVDDLKTELNRARKRQVGAI